MTLLTGDRATALGMLRDMADMQALHNTQVHPQWLEQGHAYYRAIWVECAEMLDHFGWKWWKAHSPDLDQVRLELVDIWHFGLSDLLRANMLGDATLAAFEARSPVAAGTRASGEGLRRAIESLAAATLQQRAFPLAEFVDVMAALPLDFSSLYRLYIGKNVLNRFRQDNGYKEGHYRKHWDGREDNEELVRLATSLLPGTPGYADALYERLDARYREVNGAG